MNLKAIFYVLSILVIGASAYFALDSSKKVQSQIDTFRETRDTKQRVEQSIAKTEGELSDTEGALTEAKNLNSELESTKENEIAKETSMQKSLDKYDTEIAEHDAELAKLAQVMEEIKAKIGDIEWSEVPDKITELQEERKTQGTRLDELIMITTKLTKEVSDKRAENTRQNGRLADIRKKIALNSKVGAITTVDSTWGFVIVNLGTNNSNVTPQSKLLVSRNGTLLGSLKPTSVEATQTVCDLNARDLKSGVRIQPGDRVTLAESVGN